MSSLVRDGRLLVALAAALAGAVSGCFDSNHCKDEEICNYRDDDCDGRYDEDFRDESGRYVNESNCGGCGVDCGQVFPTAGTTACEDPGPPGIAVCRITSCRTGFHPSGEGGCAPDLVVLCRPCRADAECTANSPDAICDGIDAATGLGRCMPACDAATPCAAGTHCVPGAESSHCVADDVGFCECGPDAFGTEFGCLLTSPSGLVCEGVSICEAAGPSACVSLAVEDCDGMDDDCDGEADEDFVDANGLYVTRTHCGGCNQPCSPPGANMSADCVVDPGNVVRCETECLTGFVDVDGIAANGCECQRWNGSGPPPSAGGDGDCDGVPDDSTDFVYVAPTGNDANVGSLALPKRTLGAGLAAAGAAGKDVLVARGIYDGPVTLVDGVSIYGGYRPDFRDRNLTLYPVSIVSTSPGQPALVCRNLGSATRVDGITVEGSDAVTSGQGSTAAYFDGCASNVSLVDVTIFAGRGADGIRGTSSAEALAAMGGGTLADLDGVDGTRGTADPSTASCRTIPAGVGGAKSCFGTTVAGGDGGTSGCPPISCTNGGRCPNAGCTDYTSGGVCDFATVMSLAVPNGAGTTGGGTGGGAGGEATYNSPTNRRTCNFCDDNPTLPRDGVPGVDGATGLDGAAGLGCSAAPVLDVATGRMRGTDGTDGLAGTNGAGGGGGSGGSGYAVIGGTDAGCSNRPGGSGGGGGSGGCGAPGTTRGQGGGASIGLVVRFGAAAFGPAMERVRVVPVSGGAGGDGGIAADGGAAGAGDSGGRPSFWCSRSGGRGGDGGEGGASGGAGGGCGGGSHGLAIVAAGLDATVYLASLTGLTIEATGSGGAGGVGGFSPGNAGSDGNSGNGSPRFVLP